MRPHLGAHPALEQADHWEVPDVVGTAQKLPLNWFQAGKYSGQDLRAWALAALLFLRRIGISIRIRVRSGGDEGSRTPPSRRLEGLRAGRRPAAGASLSSAGVGRPRLFI